jgi:DNA-binding transcriptional LysR family regulator
VVTNDSEVMLSLAESGAGLTYALEPAVQEQLRTGRLKVVLEAYAPTVPGFFLYFPSRAQRSPPLRLFVEAAKEFALRGVK